MNPGMARAPRGVPTSGQVWRPATVASFGGGDRVPQLERQRRQELLTPAALAMLLLAASGFLPAIRPTFVPIMVGGLAAVIILFTLAIGLNRARFVRTGIGIFIFGQLAFYAVALFLPPSGSHGELSLMHFTAGNLYYFLADVLPIFAAALMTEMPWPILVNLAVFGMNMICIWVLPHDATFDAFAANLGGPLFLAASITLGQVVLIIFGMAAASTIRRSLTAASRVSDLEENNQRVAERQRVLEVDIRTIQQTHAQIANGEQAHAALPPTSELYALATSLNLMVDRLARLARAGAELRQIELGLSEASAVIGRMGQGDLSVRPTPTGTIVDGLLASLVQVQGQIAGWVNSIARSLDDAEHIRGQALEAASDVMLAMGQTRDLLARESASENRDVAELALLAQQNAERLLNLLRAIEERERMIATAVERIRTTSTH